MRLTALAIVFVPISLLSFGGSNAIIADIEHQTVAVHHWMTGREFADFFALSRAAGAGSGHADGADRVEGRRARRGAGGDDRVAAAARQCWCTSSRGCGEVAQAAVA